MKKKPDLIAPSGFQVVTNINAKCGRCNVHVSGGPMLWREKGFLERRGVRTAKTEIICLKCGGAK
jgi:hypothetical protein